MKNRSLLLPRVLVSLSIIVLFAVFVSAAEADVSFLGVASGDASTTTAVVWTRALPAGTSLDVELTTDPSFSPKKVTRLADACVSDGQHDATCKAALSNLTPDTVYYYRFVADSGDRSIVGRFKTAPKENKRTALRFAFSGDN